MSAQTIQMSKQFKSHRHGWLFDPSNYSNLCILCFFREMRSEVASLVNAKFLQKNRRLIQQHYSRRCRWTMRLEIRRTQSLVAIQACNVIISIIKRCGMTELGSQGKLHTDYVTFEIVQRMVMNQPSRLGGGHKEGMVQEPHLYPFSLFSIHWPNVQLLTSASLCFLWLLESGGLELLVIAPPLSAFHQ